MDSLHKQISNNFNLGELHVLCTEIGINYENVRGETLDEIAMELVQYCERHGRTTQLLTTLKRERPHIDWPDPQYPIPDPQPPAPSPQSLALYTLPQRPQHFTGRDDEIETLTTHLHAGQTVTLWAAGGMGKTAIALETIHRLKESGEFEQRFPDGLHFFSFYGRPQNENLYQELVTRFDPRSTEFTFAYAQRLLAGKRLLLILDGAEDAEDIGKAMQLRGDNGLLITTRDRRTRGGKRIAVELLPLELAKQLLIKWSDGAVDDALAEGFCAEIGRLPLALRIAGAYLDESGETPAAYLDALRQTPIRELHRDDKREESVDILLTRTVAQLDEPAQTALALLGRMAMLPVSEDPLAAVLGSDALRPALATLNRFGLINREDSSVTLTHALTYSYAQLRLPQTDAQLSQLADFWTELAKTESARGAVGYKELHSIHPHIFAVLNQCVARGLWETTDTLVWAMKDYLSNQGLTSEWIESMRIGIQATRALGDRHNESHHLGNLGVAYRNLGQVETAIEFHKQAIGICREINYVQGEGIWLGHLGTAYSNLGRIDTAIRHYQQALRISRQIGYREGEGDWLGNLGNVYSNLGEFKTAINHYEQALAISREIGDQYGEGVRLGNLGVAFRNLGQISTAIDFFKESLSISREIGYRLGEENQLGNLGLAYQDIGQMKKAIRHYEQALVISREISHRQGEGISLANLGIAHARLGQTEKSIGFFKQALTISSEIGYRQGEGNQLANLGFAYIELGRVEKAKSCLTKSLQIFKEIKSPKAEIAQKGLDALEVGRP